MDNTLTVAPSSDLRLSRHFQRSLMNQITKQHQKGPISNQSRSVVNHRLSCWGDLRFAVLPSRRVPDMAEGSSHQFRAGLFARPIYWSMSPLGFSGLLTLTLLHSSGQPSRLRWAHDRAQVNSYIGATRNTVKKKRGENLFWFTPHDIPDPAEMYIEINLWSGRYLWKNPRRPFQSEIRSLNHLFEKKSLIIISCIL